MRNKKSGFTLVEIIVSLTLICIIAIGIIPTFAAQLRMTIDTKKITEQTFDAQGEIERLIMDLKGFIVNPGPSATTPGGVTVQTDRTIFGRNVKSMYRLEKDFPTNENKSFLVFLSKRLAQMEVRTLLLASGVRIEVSGETVHKVADLKKTPKPTLTGLCNPNTDPNFYVNLYNWYVSKEGDPNPTFPDDYDRITFPGVTPSTLTDLSRLANKYVVLGVTPVDIHGVRGNEATSSNVVYVLGEEWRAGKFAWVDKNEDAVFTGGTDVAVNKVDGLIWPLVKDPSFDTQNVFHDPDPQNPADGSLYVPMWIGRTTENPVVPIQISGTDVMNWVVDKSINLATDITVSSGANHDIKMKTRDGNITLYQFVEINPATEKVVYKADGMPSLLERGTALNAPNGNISLGTEGRGKVILQNYTKIDAGKDITLDPYGDINLYQATLEAGGSILIDSSKGLTFPGERTTDIRDSNLTLKGSGVSGRSITLKARNTVKISDTVIQGNRDAASSIRLIAPNVVLKNTSFKDSQILINNTTTMQSGGWDANSALTVADGIGLSVSVSGDKVNNLGALVMGNTGGISFSGSMESNLVNPLAINLTKGASDKEVVVSTNYGRNVGYADSSTDSIGLSGEYLPLGSGITNMEYTVEKISGYGDVSLSCSFDGTDRITINASGTGPISSYYTLKIADRYAEDVVGTIVFKVTAGEGETAPTVYVIGSAIPSFTVTFDKNGAPADAVPPTMTVRDGEALGTLPVPPSYFGHSFTGWNTNADGSGSVFNAATIVTNNITVYAQFTTVPVCTVIFEKNGGDTEANPKTILVEQGKTVRTLPVPPQRSGWWFKNWTMTAGGGTVFTENTTVSAMTTTVYAQWTPDKKHFSSIATGDYISISGRIFQKISDDKILAVERVPNGYSNSMEWNTANRLAADYSTSLRAANSWVKASGLLDGTTIGNLKSYYGSILQKSYYWWGDSYNTRNAYYVYKDYDYWNDRYYDTADKTSNSLSCRPYLSVDSTNLYVNSGAGTLNNPYQLTLVQ